MPVRRDVHRGDQPVPSPSDHQWNTQSTVVPDLPKIKVTGSESSAFRPAAELTGSQEVDNFVAMSSSQLLDDIVQIQDEAISKRVLLQNHCQDFHEQFLHFVAALESFYDLDQSIDVQLAAGPSQQSNRQSLQEILDRIKRSNAILNDREEMIQQTANKSCIIDDKLLRREKSLLHRINKARERHSLNSPHPNMRREDDSSYASSSTSEDSKQSEATIVREYYDKLAQANSLRDGVINFEAAAAGERRRRERLRIMQQAVEPSETEFLQSYLAKRKDKYLAFQEALQEAHRLRDECMGNGHNVEEPGIPPLSEENLTTESLNEVDSLLVSDANNASRVAQWVQDQGVPISHKEPPSKSPVTHVSRTNTRQRQYAQSNSFGDTKSNTILLSNNSRCRSASQPLMKHIIEFRRRSVHEIVPHSSTDLALSTGISTPNSAPALHSQASCFRWDA